MKSLFTCICTSNGYNRHRSATYRSFPWTCIRTRKNITSVDV